MMPPIRSCIWQKKVCQFMFEELLVLVTILTNKCIYHDWGLKMCEFLVDMDTVVGHQNPDGNHNMFFILIFSTNSE